MAVNLSFLAGAGWQFFDNSGNPLTGGKLYSYTAGTTTPEPTYTTISGLTNNSNPIILDSAGRPPNEIWLTDGIKYKFILYTSDNVLIGSYDNISSIGDFTSIFAALANTTDVNKGDALVGFKQSNTSGVYTNAIGRTVHDKFQEYVSVKDFGATGDGVTDDTLAFVAAATATPYIKVPLGSYNVNLTTGNAKKVLEALNGMQTDVPLTLNLAAGVYEYDSLILNAQNGNNINLKGATPITTSILGGTPSVTATSSTGFQSTYAITLPVSDASQFDNGDWVIVKTLGVDLTYTSYDETVNGARHNELDGFWEVLSVNTSGTHTITFKNKSRQSSNQFPGAGSIAAATANVTGGSITKLSTVFKYYGTSGIQVKSNFGTLENIGIVGDNTGSNTIGLDIDSSNTLPSNNSKSISAYNLGIANFTGPGLNCDGATATFSGDKIFSSGHNTHGFRISGTVATITNSMASGCGLTVGNGFFGTNGSIIYCSNSIANGVRNTGFIANRVSTMTAESCVSISNGNYAEEVAGGFSAAEGKGFESEAGSKMYCDDSVAIFQTTLGFYALAASTTTAFRCVSNGHLRLHGYYCIFGSKMSARYSVAKNNVGRGFYAYINSSIDANNSLSQNNALDYVVQGVGSMTTNSLVTVPPYTPTYNVQPDCSGANQIIESNTFQLGTKLILTRGNVLTIASGAVTATNSFHKIDTEGAAATDDLDTINGGVDGMIIILGTLTSARDVTVKNNTGNIILAGGADITLTNLADKLTLFYDSIAAKWYQIAFADNL